MIEDSVYVGSDTKLYQIGQDGQVYAQGEDGEWTIVLLPDEPTILGA